MPVVVRHLLVGTLLLASLAPALSAPVPSPPTDKPDPETVKRVEERQRELSDLALELRLAAQPLSPMLQARRDRAFAAWKADLESSEAYRYRAAVADLENGYLGPFPEGPVVEFILPLLKKPEGASLERLTAQGLMLEALVRHYPARAKTALPDLLRFVADDRVPVYLRSMSIDATAKLAPGAPEVVKVFIKALENPNPKSTSGVHDRIAERLGEMGKAAFDARPAMRKLSERGVWYGDVAYLALGKLARDDPPQKLDVYLGRLKKIDNHEQDEIAAAFLHVQAICHPGSPIIGPNTRHHFTYEKLDKDLAARARVVLWKVADERKDDMHARMALRTLLAIRPGSSAEAARILTRNFETKWTRENEGTIVGLSEYCLEQFDATDPEAIPFLVESFGKQAGNRNFYTIPRELARVLALYGKQAKAVAPTVIRALRGYVPDPNPGSAGGEVFGGYVSLLAAVGGESSETHAVIFELLAPKGPVLAGAKDAAPLYRLELLRGLAGLGLPAKGKERTAGLEHLREALGSDLFPIFLAGASMVVKESSSLTDEEWKPLLPLLTRVLGADFKFHNAATGLAGVRVEFGPDAGRWKGPEAALSTLASLGGKARDAAPAVKAIADRPLKEWKAPSFLPEPPENALIRSAQKTLEAIRGPARER